MAHDVLSTAVVDRKRSETERRKAVRSTPSPEAIQASLDTMATAVRGLRTDVQSLIKRPNVLPWRPKSTDDEEKKGG
jgi:hypothetical protein